MKLYVICVAMLFASVCSAQTIITGSSLVYRSAGSSSGTSWILDRDGYVGTYITLAAPGNVTIGIDAIGTPAGGINPHVSVAIADAIQGFDVTSGTHSNTFSLPAGTFFVRTQFDNDLALTARQVRVNSMTVTGAAVANAATTANALAASDSYIANYRKGKVTINLAGLGLPAGSSVGVSLKKLAYSWGTVAPGSNNGVNSYLGSGAQATNYQAKLLANFNAIGTENAGKWADTESTRYNPTMSGVDAVLNYAMAHNLNTRLHTFAYDLSGNDPSWVSPLSAANLKTALAYRADYYLPESRALKVGELDVFNESYQSACCRGSGSHWSELGASGFADVFNDLKAGMGSATTRLAVNEYNALIYANGNAAGYFPYIEDILRAGAPVGAIGTQHYPWSLFMHSPSDMLKAMQTYAITGLPQTLTELGAFTDQGLSPSDAATILGDTMRLEFGNPNSTGVYLWGFHRENGGGNLFAPGLALYDVNTSNWNNWTITPAGKVWQDKLGVQDWDGNAANGWNTQLTQQLAANGTINFDGYYGDYVITAGGKTYNLSLTKGTSQYAIGVLPGDINADGVVDARDYVAWRKNGGSAANYNLWRTHFGQSALASGTIESAAVPEPCSLALLIFPTFSCLAVGRRKSVPHNRV